MNKSKVLSAIALAVSFAVSGCGGGGGEDGSNTETPVEPAPEPVGAIQRLPDDQFIMTALDGDTFSLKFNRNSGKATIHPLNTMYGVEEMLDIPFKVFETNLGITIFTSNYGSSEDAPAWFEIATSPDGNEIIGEVRMAKLNSNVIGTNLKINRTQGLPITGTYNGVSQESVSANGKNKLIDFGIKNVNGQLSYCDNGFYANNVCTGTEHDAAFSTTFGGMASLMVNINGRNVQYAYLLLAQNGNDYSIILDRIRNADGQLVYGTGFAVAANPMSLNTDRKSFVCIKPDASGGSLLTLNRDLTFSQGFYDSGLKPLGDIYGTLTLNKAVVKSNVVDANGLVSLVEGQGQLPTNPTTKFNRALNFGQNMMIHASENEQTLSLCRSDSLVAKN